MLCHGYSEACNSKGFLHSSHRGARNMIRSLTTQHELHYRPILKYTHSTKHRRKSKPEILYSYVMWCSTLLYFIPLISGLLYSNSIWISILFYFDPFCFILLYFNRFYLSYCIALYCIVFYLDTVWYYSILYCLFYLVLFFSILFCSVFSLFFFCSVLISFV